MADAVLRALRLAASDEVETAQRLIARVLAAACDELEMDAGFVARFDGDDEVFVDAVGNAASFGVEPGHHVAADTLYCRSVAGGILPNAVADASADDRFRAFEVTTARQVRAYIGVPITFASGYTFGTLCCLSHSPDPTLGARDVRFMRVLARLLATQLEEREHELASAADARARIEGVISRGGPAIVFQPIVDLRTGDAVAVEALARFPTSPTTAAWFVDAAIVGRATELELAALGATIALADDVPPELALAVNIGAEAAARADLGSLLPEAVAARVVLEVTEGTAIDDYATLHETLLPLRERGIRLAVDDIGSGFASLGSIVGLRPDVLKLDLWLTRGIDHDPVRRALAAAAVSFAREVGAALVSEGIETAAEAETLAAIGVGFGQGYHLARPAPLADLGLRHR